MIQQNHLMIDVETMGTGPMAPIIQIGAVLFDNFTGEERAAYCASLDLTELTDVWGRECDPSTVEWWSTQNQDILNHIRATARPVKEVWAEFSAGLAAAGVEKNTPIWSHATFDFPLVNTHLNMVGLKPLYYRAARDIRTLVDLADLDLKAYNWGKEKTHNALDDCRFQVKYCVDAMAKIRKGC